MTISHADRSHALYAASASSRWMNCYGSIQRAAGVPSGLVSGYALDGTEAHELLNYALLHGYTSAHEAKIMSGMEWTHRHDDEEIRLESVQDALDDVQGLLEAYDTPNMAVFYETRFKFPTHDNDDCGGTSDVTLFIPDLDICIIADFKHGSGVAVDAIENTQMLMYAVGSRQALRQRGMCNSGKTLYRMRIMQPRAYHREGQIREWTCDDLRLDHFIGEVNFAIQKTKERVPEIKPGRYCRWCPAVSACPEAEEHRMKAVLPTYNDPRDVVNQGLPPITELSVERIAEILSMADMVEEWLTAVRSQATALAKDGVAIPGHKLVFAQARSKWAATTEFDQAATANFLATLVGVPVNTFYKPRLVTITQARDAVRKAIYAKVGKENSKKSIEAANIQMAPLTIKDTSGNIVLVSRDDKRPEVNLANLIEYKAPSTIADKP